MTSVSVNEKGVRPNILALLPTAPKLLQNGIFILIIHKRLLIDNFLGV